MYQYVIQTRISYSIGLGLLIFSIVFGWVSFAVPDWLQYYEQNKSENNITTNTNITLRKFGLWRTCRFSYGSNDFTCTQWNQDTPSFTSVAQALVPIGLTLGCLSFIFTLFVLICRRSFVSVMLIAALCAFLNFVFITIGVCVFATDSVVFVNRLNINGNENPRRWGMWLLIPNLVLAFLASVCFIIASLLNWCDYQNMQVTGILSHSGDKYNGSVCKGLSDSNTTTALKQYYPQQDYPTTCYQLNGANNNQPNSMGYPTVPPNYGGLVNSAYQPTPPGLFGYSRSATPPANQMYPHTNFDPYYPRNYMNETMDSDSFPRMSRSRRRSRSHSRRQSEYRSRSVSPVDNSTADNNNQKQTQFIPIPVPYYQPQPLPTSQSVQVQQSNVPKTNNTNSVPYTIPQSKQYVDENIQPKTTNIFKYIPAQPSVVVSNPTPPVYTIAYRANNGGNVITPNILTGPPATTYVTATRNQIEEVTSLNNESDKDEDSKYQTISKLTNSKKFSINEAWTWHKM